MAILRQKLQILIFFIVYGSKIHYNWEFLKNLTMPNPQDNGFGQFWRFHEREMTVFGLKMAYFNVFECPQSGL